MLTSFFRITSLQVIKEKLFQLIASFILYVYVHLCCLTAWYKSKWKSKVVFIVLIYSPTTVVTIYNLNIFSIRGCERVFFSTGREEHETDCKYRPIPCQYQIHGCKAVFSQKVKYVFKCRLLSRFLYFSCTQLVPLKYYFFLVKILWIDRRKNLVFDQSFIF